jgi:hypothetical protein
VAIILVCCCCIYYRYPWPILLVHHC